MNYIGIDPGYYGGISVITEDNKHIWSWQMPSRANDLIHILKQAQDYEEQSYCFIERVLPMPYQNILATECSMKNDGFIIGVLLTLRIQFTEISPAYWKKRMKLSSEKYESIDMCKKLYPTSSMILDNTPLNYDDGIAESILLAHFGIHILPSCPEHPRKPKIDKKGREIKNNLFRLFWSER